MATEVDHLLEIAGGTLMTREARSRIREAGSLRAAVDQYLAELKAKASAAGKAHRFAAGKVAALRAAQLGPPSPPDGADVSDASAEGPQTGSKRPRAAELPTSTERAPKRPRSRTTIADQWPGCPKRTKAQTQANGQTCDDDDGASVHLGDIVLPNECLVAPDECDGTAVSASADVVHLDLRDDSGPAVCALRTGGAHGRLLLALREVQRWVVITRTATAQGLHLSVSTAAASLRGNVMDPARHLDGRSKVALQMEVLMRHWYPKAFDGVDLDEGNARRLVEIVRAEERDCDEQINGSDAAVAESSNSRSRGGNGDRSAALAVHDMAVIDPASEQQKALVSKRSHESFELEDLYAKLRPKHPALADQPKRV